MGLVQTIIDRDREYAEPLLSEGLRELYDGDLQFRTPPFGAPLSLEILFPPDGVVSYKIKGHADGSTISDSDPADRFIIGLLRASADAVMAGPRTVHDVSPPDAKHLYTEYRVNALHKPQCALVVIVSGSGKLELERAIFRTPGVRTAVITTPAGRDELARAGATKLGSVQIYALDGNGGSIAPLEMLRLLSLQFGVRILLHEGGLTLFGQFLAAAAVDELFMTVPPQIAGRQVDAVRPALVRGVEFVPDCAPWFQLLSVKQNAEHLYPGALSAQWPGTDRRCCRRFLLYSHKRKGNRR